MDVPADAGCQVKSPRPVAGKSFFYAFMAGVEAGLRRWLNEREAARHLAEFEAVERARMTHVFSAYRNGPRPQA